MRRALIGYTGFVGSTLARAGEFTDLFNSSNIETIRGRRFDEIVCAGVPAVKWLANRDPQNDLHSIDRLLSPLLTCEAGMFTLISTIDVYPDPSSGADEETAIDGSINHPYGKHRLMVEEKIRAHFVNCLVLRLPALFGDGLKKNVIFDLLTNNQSDKINPASSFQWYNLDRLAGDIKKARDLELTLVNLFPQPLPTERIVTTLFDGARVGLPVEPAPLYSTRTIHSGAFGGPDGYISSTDEVMADLSAFVDRYRRHAEEKSL